MVSVCYCYWLYRISYIILDQSQVDAFNSKFRSRGVLPEKLTAFQNIPSEKKFDVIVVCFISCFIYILLTVVLVCTTFT